MSGAEAAQHMTEPRGGTSKRERGSIASTCPCSAGDASRAARLTSSSAGAHATVRSAARVVIAATPGARL